MSATTRAPLLDLGEALARYGFGKHHPFGPQRMAAFVEEARRQGLLERVRVLAPCMASEAAHAFVPTADLHEDGRLLYPGTGFTDETGTRRRMSVPLPPGSSSCNAARIRSPATRSRHWP